MNVLSSTALSGLQAAQVRLNATANNVANLNTEGFRRDEVSAQAREGGGVTTSVGKAALPGADLVQDVVDQKMAALAFKANAQVFKTASTLTGTLLNEKA